MNPIAIGSRLFGTKAAVILKTYFYIFDLCCRVYVLLLNILLRIVLFFCENNTTLRRTVRYSSHQFRRNMLHQFLWQKILKVQRIRKSKLESLLHKVEQIKQW
jgi:hypothetical protein